MLDQSLISSAASAISSDIKDRENVLCKDLSGDSLPVNKGVTSSIVDVALDSDFNSPSELVVKKAMSAAIIIAKQKGLLPEDILDSVDSNGAAMVADEGFVRVKTAYKVSSGLIDIYEASDLLIDNVTSRTLAIADIFVEKGVDTVISKIGFAIATAYPPLVPLVFVINSYQSTITSKAQQYVKKGISRLNMMAKSAIRTVGNLAKRTIISKLKN